MGGRAWHVGVLRTRHPQLSQAISQPGAVGLVRRNREGQPPHGSQTRAQTLASSLSCCVMNE